MAISRREAAEMVEAAINASRRGTDGLYANAWSGTSGNTPPVRVFVKEQRLRKRKRMGRTLDVSEKKDIGYVEIGTDGRVWLNKLAGKVGKLGRVVERAIGGVMVFDDSTGEEVAVRVMKPRAQE